MTRFLARIELRHAWRWTASILLLALAGGASLIAAQAARRTDTAFTRALAEAHASDAVVNADTFTYDPAQSAPLRAKGNKLLDAVDRLPMVVAHGRFGGENLFVVRGGKVDQRFNTGSAFGLVAYDKFIGRTVSTLRLSEGRLARPDRADEIVITPQTARLAGWRLGDVVTTFRVYGPDEFAKTGAPLLNKGTRLRMHVVGIGQVPDDFLYSSSERLPRVFLTPAFRQRFPNGDFYLNEWVRLRHGHADLDDLRVAVARIGRAVPEVEMPVSPTGDGLINRNRANDPLVNGLWILAGLAAAVGILLAAQSLGRSFSSRANDHAQLRAIGATRSQRVSVELTTLAVVAIIAALLAVVIGWLFSPLTPIGSAREVEPHPGFAFDLSLSALAFFAIFVGTVLAALPAVLRLASTRDLPGSVAHETRARRSRVADLVAQSGLAPSATIGTRLALQPGHGETATPVRSVLTSLVLVVATVSATFAFGANLQRWTETPSLYGWNWDAALGSNFGGIPPEFEKPLAHYENVVEAGGLNVGKLFVGRHSIPAIGMSPVRGSIAPIIDRGRVPRNAREIAFGAKTMSALHTHIGATVTGTVVNKRVRLEVVGRTSFPSFGNERFGGTGLGKGALGTTELFRMQNPDAPGEHFNYMVLRFAPGTATKTEAKLRVFLNEQGCVDVTCLLTGKSPSIRPVEIDGYRSASGLPATVAVVLVLLLVATLTHVLLTTMRRRAADLAVLRAIGASSRNLSAILRWQALVLTGAAILIGVPLGLIGSRFAWAAFSRSLGIAPGTVTPLLVPALAAIGLLALAWILATLAGLRVPSVARRHRFSGQ